MGRSSRGEAPATLWCCVLSTRPHLMGSLGGPMGGGMRARGGGGAVVLHRLWSHADGSKRCSARSPPCETERRRVWQAMIGEGVSSTLLEGVSCPTRPETQPGCAR